MSAEGWAVIIAAVGLVLSGLLGQWLTYSKARETGKVVEETKKVVDTVEKNTNSKLTTTEEKITKLEDIITRLNEVALENAKEAPSRADFEAMQRMVAELHQARISRAEEREMVTPDSPIPVEVTNPELVVTMKEGTLGNVEKVEVVNPSTEPD